MNIDWSELQKQSKQVSYTYPVVIFYITVAQYQNWEIDMGAVCVCVCVCVYFYAIFSDV
jgi:hypothetical protein